MGLNQNNFEIVLWKSMLPPLHQQWLRFCSIKLDVWTFTGIWYFPSFTAIEDQLLAKLWPPLNFISKEQKQSKTEQKPSRKVSFLRKPPAHHWLSCPDTVILISSSGVGSSNANFAWSFCLCKKVKQSCMGALETARGRGTSFTLVQTLQVEPICQSSLAKPNQKYLTLKI